MFGRLIQHGFSQAKEEFAKTYILRLKYKDDAYDITSRILFIDRPVSASVQRKNQRTLKG